MKHITVSLETQIRAMEAMLQSSLFFIPLYSICEQVLSTSSFISSRRPPSSLFSQLLPWVGSHVSPPPIRLAPHVVLHTPVSFLIFHIYRFFFFSLPNLRPSNEAPLLSSALFCPTDFRWFFAGPGVISFHSRADYYPCKEC